MLLYTASCLKVSRGYYKDYKWWPGCTRIGPQWSKNIAYACWFYIQIRNNCKHTPKVIYLNGCDKKNGFFHFFNPIHYISVAKGPTFKYGDFASCSMKYTYPIKPNRTLRITYLVDVPTYLNWTIYKNWAPYNTWLWGVKW